MLLLGCLEGLTLYVLSKFAERYEAGSYSRLVRRTLGRKLAGVLSWSLLLYLFGCCTAYMVGGAWVSRGKGWLPI